VRHRFEREARSIARVDHPGVVGVHDSGELDDGSFFIVMERLVGCDLAVLVRRRGPGTPAQVASLLRQGGAALSAAHRARLVHRDVKPENIFLTTETHGFRVKMLDFGLAIEAVTDTRLTQAGLLVGTPMFMSPEQILGHPVDHRSDIYSFASVAFLALTGRRTTTESELAGIMLELVRGSPPAVSSVLPWVPPEIDEAFVRALARAPEDRPDDAEAWVGTFASVLEGLEPHGAGWPLGQALADIGSDLKRRDDAGAVTVARRD
jgi:serine/threonine protein kinase